MSNELSPQESHELDSLTEEEAIALWKKRNAPTRSKTNYLKLDNRKLIADPNDSEAEPIINPDFGKISSTRYEEGVEDPIVEKLPVGFIFFPALTRVQIEGRAYITDTNGKQHPQYICKEVNQFEDIEVMDFTTKEVVYRGPYKGAKETFDLKYKVAIYAYIGTHMYRWLVGGKDTLGSWFRISNALKEADCPMTVKMTKVIPQKNSGIYWNDLEFELGDSFDFKLALKLGDELDKQLNRKVVAEEPVQAAPTEDVGEVIIDDPVF